MNTTARPAILALLTASVALPQAAVDWPSFGGDARRTGWERSDTMITKDNVKDFRLVLKRKLEGTQPGAWSSTPPVVIGRLISYRGFKELGFVTNSAGDLWSIDVDLNRVFWKKRFATASGPCSGIATAPALTPPAVFGRRTPGTSAAKPGGTNTPSPGLPPTNAGRNSERPLPDRLGGGGFGGPRPVYVITADGKLNQVNTSDASDRFPPLDFLPAGAKSSGLTLHNHVMYTTTLSGCGTKSEGGVWALDLSEEAPRPASFALNAGEAVGPAGFAVGTDGTAYVQTGTRLLALAPGDLKLKGSFSFAGEANATPVVFDFGGRDVVVTAGSDGRLHVIDSQKVGDAPVYQSQPLTTAGGRIWGGLSSWEDADGVRWVAAPVWGAVNPGIKTSGNNGAAPNGAIIAFRVEEQGGKPVLSPAWISRDLISPVAPVVTSGSIFVLSTGGYTGQGSEWKPKSGAQATFYALDAATGKEVYSSGTQITGPASLTGLSLANGRVYFTTFDGTLYAFGVYLEI